jgi:hypothetical protein
MSGNLNGPRWVRTNPQLAVTPGPTGKKYFAVPQKDGVLPAQGIQRGRTSGLILSNYAPTFKLKPGKAAALLWPRVALSEADKFDHYSRLLAFGSHKIKADTPVLIGLRGIELYSEKTHAVRSKKSYDDAFVLLELKRDGFKKVREFKGATHPYQRRSGQAPDVNALTCRVKSRNVSDVGMIRPGVYSMRSKKQHHGLTALKITTTTGGHRIPVIRDTNHDGKFSSRETRNSLTRRLGCQVSRETGDYAKGILFHPGYTEQHGDNPRKTYSSIGCQTASLKDVNALVDAQRRKGKIIYILFDADSLIDWLHRNIQSISQPPFGERKVQFV